MQKSLKSKLVNKIGAHELLEDLLDESRLRREGYFHFEPIRRKWEEYFSGNRNWKYHLWNILMFQAKLEANHG